MVFGCSICCEDCTGEDTTFTDFGGPKPPNSSDESREIEIILAKVRQIVSSCDAQVAELDRLKQAYRLRGMKPYVMESQGTAANGNRMTKQNLEHVSRDNKSGSSYVGYVESVSCNKHGFGKYSYAEKGPNGEPSFYEGEWSDNKAHGLGRLVDSLGEFCGAWTIGDKNGSGVESWFEDGTVFKGTYVKGVKEGIGLYQWSDGSIYEGEIRQNVVAGKGRLVDEHGTYTGNFENNCQHGYGKWAYKNGDVYEGFFKDSVQDGVGTFQWKKRARKYTGQWKRGMPWGVGQMTENGKTRRVWYWNGKAVSEEEYERTAKQNLNG